MMATTTFPEEDYRQAAALEGFENSRADALARSALRQSEALVEQGQQPLSPIVVRIAAVLMASTDKYSSPTALAEAVNLANTPGLGEALLNIQNGLSYLAQADVRQQVEHDALLRSAVEHVVGNLIKEMKALLKAVSGE